MKRGQMDHCYLILLKLVIIFGGLHETTSSTIAPKSGELMRGSSLDTDVVNFRCISNWKQLLDMFHKKNSLFDVSRDTAMIVFNVRTFAHNTTGNTAPSPDPTCCTLDDTMDECQMMYTFVQSIFGMFPAPLLMSMGCGILCRILNNYELMLQRSLQELCWAPEIPFCHDANKNDIVQGFATKLLSSKVAGWKIEYLQAWSFTPDLIRSRSKGCASLLNATLLSTSLTILMSMLWLAKRCKHSFHPKATVGKALLFSTMLQSWIWFLFFYGNQFSGLTLFWKLLQSRNAVLSYAYMPYVDIGYLTYGIMGSLFLVEFPFLLWYFNVKILFPNGSSQCCLMLKSVGCAGMVLLVQVLPSYLVCHFIGLLIFPLVSLLLICSLVILFSLLTACTALVILPCLAGCRRCPQKSCFFVFFIFLALSCTGVLIILNWIMDFSVLTMLNANIITSGLFVSFTFAVLGFGLRSLLTQQKAYREDYSPLLP